jgi:hypothetical protein
VSRLALGSFASALALAVDRSEVQPLAAITYVLQDEIPMTMRVQADEAVTQIVRPSKDKATVKVLQSEVICGFLVRCVASGAFQFVWLELPTSLQSVQTSSAVQLKEALTKQIDAPLIAALGEKFPLQIDLSTGDRANANLLMEKLFRASRPGAHRLSGLGCRVHCLHTVCGKATSMYSDIISSCISLALVQREAGTVASLRAAIARVLEDFANLLFDLGHTAGWTRCHSTNTHTHTHACCFRVATCRKLVCLFTVSFVSNKTLF